MEAHRVRVHPAAARLPREGQLAWKLAAFAAAAPPRASMPTSPRWSPAASSTTRRSLSPPSSGPPWPRRAPWRSPIRAQAEQRSSGCPRGPPSTRSGRAWANGTAARELDFHDTFLAADYAHPADSIPPLLAVAQQKGTDGARLLAAIAAAYEVHVSLVKGICLHAQKKDHVAHLAPAIAAGLGALLGLETSPSSTTRSTRRCTSASRRASPARARSPPGRRPPPPGRESSPSRRWTARCGARAPRTPSTRARTASSPGCWPARTPSTPSPCPRPASAPAGSSRPTRRPTRRSTRPRR